ncbi:LuxR family transcriptional regulator [Humibacter sp. BT305]|nr:LuxR family transcriptional regulator [Humibacter sp. BT305]
MSDIERDVDRDESVRVVREALESGRGIVVSGPPGSGRSHLVRTVVAGLAEPVRRRIRVHDQDRSMDAAARHREAEAVARGQVVPVVIESTSAPLEGWLRRLVDENGLARVRLAPWGREAMLRLSHRFLGGPLDPQIVPALIPARDGGDLVVLREALHDLQAVGSLVDRDGQWRLEAPIPPIESLRRLIFSRMGFEDPVDPVETVIDVVALAPELGTDRTRIVLERILGIDPLPTIEMLAERGVLDIVDHPDGAVSRVHDPVSELMLVRSMARLRRRRLSNAIVADLTTRSPGDATDAELVCLARLALPLGWELDGTTLARAAETALRASRTRLAEHLATAALMKGAPVEATFVLAVAESQSGRSAVALKRLEELDPSQLLPRHDRTLRELVRLLRARRDDPTSQWNVPSLAAQERDGVEGAPADDAELAALSRPDPPIGAGVWADEAVVLRGERMGFDAAVMAMKGHTRAAVDLLVEAEGMLRDAGADTFRVRWGRIYTRMWDQSFDRTLLELEFLGDEAASLGRSDQEALCRWCTGLGLQHSGRVSEAIPVLRSALAALEQQGFAEPALLAHVSLAKALALAGHHAAATDVLAPVLEAGGGPLVAGWLDDAKGWMQLSAGEPEAAARSFIDAAAVHAGYGYPLFQMIALSGAARSGAAAQVIDQVDELAGLVEGECIALLVRQARALARRETGATEGLVAEFEAIADTVVRLGMRGHAAQSYAIAAELHTAAGDARAAAAASRLGAEQTALCGSEWFGTRHDATRELSDRELEIAELAVLGLSNREIADHLVISVRTVETHLLRVFRKTGIRQRADLRRALGGSARPAPGPLHDASPRIATPARREPPATGRP